MGIQDDIRKADRAVKDLEIRLNTAVVALNSVRGDAEVLRSDRDALEYNLAFLKQKSIVAIAKEYRKSKEELKIIQAKLSKLNHDIIEVNNACIQLERAVKNAKTYYQDLCYAAEHNVVRGRFGPKS
jgi:uncharacterized protein (DUF3084 family)